MAFPRYQGLFAGRENDLRRLDDSLLKDDCQLVTLKGFGGTGKTRLALEWANRNSGAFTSGVVFADLSFAKNVDQVCQTIAGALGINLTEETFHQQIGDSLNGRTREGEGALLLILDNLEQCIKPVNELLPQWLQNPHIKVLGTSRQALGLSSERVLVLNPLEHGDEESSPAVELFVARAIEVDPNFATTPELSNTIHHICSALDGLPLAIELAAARVKVLSCAEILKRLATRLDFLRSKKKDVSQRQLSLRGAIEWSWELLSPSERALLDQLSVFENGFFLEAAEKVCQVDQSELIVDLIESLIEKSLLSSRRVGDAQATPRFFMLESVLAFAREQRLAADPEKAIVQRWRAWLVGKAQTWWQERYTKEPLQAELEQQGFWAIAHDEETSPEDAAWAVLCLTYSMSLNGPYSVARDAILHVAHRFGFDFEDKSWAITSAPELVQHLFVQYAFTYHQQDANRALTLFDRVPDASPAAFATCHGMSYIFAVQGALDRASACIDKARQIPGISDIQRVYTQSWQALILWLRGELDTSLFQLTQTEKEATSFGLLTLQAKVQSWKGQVLSAMTRYDEAIACFERSREIIKKRSADNEQANIFTNIGVVRVRQGRYQEGIKEHRKALRAYRHSGSRTGESTALTNIASVMLKTGQTREALDLLQDAYQIQSHARHMEGLAITTGCIAQAYILLADAEPSQAAEHYAQALESTLESRRVWQDAERAHTPSYFRSTTRLARIAQHLGKTDLALSTAHELEERLPKTTSIPLISERDREEARQVIREVIYGESAHAHTDAQRSTFLSSVDLIGSSPAIQDVKRTIAKVAPTNVDVLILGETGSGKEVVASAIHSLSKRSSHPFIAVNCGALPENLFESELFGHEKGAFTGADTTKIGLMESASGGTLFLDELGEMPLAMQVKLLRALQERRIRRVGGTEEIAIDVRVVAATVQNLEQLVAQDLFRRDLYYRINVMQIEVPPLRKRRADIPALAQHLLERFSNRDRDLDGSLSEQSFTLSHKASAALTAYDWPGNVRELANALRHAMALCQGTQIQFDDLPEHLRTAITKGKSEHSENDERRATIALLQKHKGNVKAAAADSGIHMVTLYRRLKTYGLKASDFRS